jgi:hypothetical protein
MVGVEIDERTDFDEKRKGNNDNENDNDNENENLMRTERISDTKTIQTFRP